MSYWGTWVRRGHWNTVIALVTFLVIALLFGAWLLLAVMVPVAVALDLGGTWADHRKRLREAAHQP